MTRGADRARERDVHASGVSPCAWAADMAQKADTEPALGAVRELVRAHAGIDLGRYKPRPVLWRIRQRMDVSRTDSLSEYAALLARDVGELEALIRVLPIHVTSFFRDEQAWNFLAESVIPALLAARVAGPPIRAWTTACSTGEEAYSLAMLLSERTSRIEGAPEFRVFATDLSGDIVARAGRGWFSAASAAPLSPERRERFFDAVNGGYRVKKELRSKLIFARHDLLNDPPLVNLDVLTCRNLLIYMDASAQEQVLALSGSALRSGGVLLLGAGEELDLARHGFAAESTRHRVHRKLQSGRMPSIAATAPPGPPAGAPLVAARLALLADEGRAAVLVDAAAGVSQVYGDVDAFLRMPAAGSPLDPLGPARGGLSVHVSVPAQQALDERRPVTTRGLCRYPGGAVTISTRVTPIEVDGELRLLLSFAARPAAETATPPREAAARAGAGVAAAAPLGEARRPPAGELQASQELQAVNEELRSLNERLGFLEERLAATRQQLAAAKEQLRLELEAGDSQRRVLTSGAVMTLLLDEQLCVRWYTPAVCELFPLVPGDMGRPITDLATRLDDPGFLDEVRAVLASGGPRQGEVEGHLGRWYLRRIGAHPQGAGGVAGVVVTFTEVAARRSSEAAPAHA